MLVWVASYPRSGNTLTLLVLRDVFEVGGLGADFNDDLSLGRLPERGLPGSAPRPWNPPAELEGLTGDELLDALRQAPEPYFIKTHRVKRATDPAPALYLVRDGRDALVSHAHFVHDNDAPRFKDQSFDSRLATLIHPGIRAHGGWSGSVQAWRERSAPTATLRFEELVANPVEAVVAACAQIGMELPDPVRSAPSFRSAPRALSAHLPPGPSWNLARGDARRAGGAILGRARRADARAWVRAAHTHNSPD